MTSNAVLIAQLNTTLADINRTIQGVIDDNKGRECTPYELKYMNGELVLAPLLVAKAQCLNGLAVLKASK